MTKAVLASAMFFVLLTGSASGNSGTSPAVKSAANAYVNAHVSDADRIALLAPRVEDALTVASKTNSSSMTILQKFNVIQEKVQAFNEVVKTDGFTPSYGGGSLGKAELDVSAGVTGLKKAMRIAFTSYTTSAAQLASGSLPKVLARFRADYGPAVVEWNSGVRLIWKLAARLLTPAI